MRNYAFVLLLLITSVALADDTYVNGYKHSNAEVLNFNGLSSSSVSDSGKARMYFDSDTSTLQCSQDGGAYADCVTASATNGTNCAAGNYPLGVDASGNSESCTLASTTRVEVQVLATSDFTTNTAVADGAFYFKIDNKIGSSNLVSVHAEVITAGTTNTTDVQIYNIDNALDMLSTKLTIDSTETGSDTAATPAVINTSNDDVDLNDVIRIDIDAISTTAAQGLIVTLGFDPR